MTQDLQDQLEALCTQAKQKVYEMRALIDKIKHNGERHEVAAVNIQAYDALESLQYAIKRN